jgi:hypothetical protein
VSTLEPILQPRFYVAGGTLPRNTASYIKREADERLYSSLYRGDMSYVLTPRQMGKSSLMVQTAQRLRERHVSVAVLDLAALGQNLSADQWYFGLIGKVGEQLTIEDELEAYWSAHPKLGPFQRFAGAVRDVVLRLRSGRVVIFVDEIDAVRSLPFKTDEFFAGIREFFNRRTLDSELSRLTFCLLGVAAPSDLIRDTRTTPFNIGVRVELSDFTVEEAAPLAQGLCGELERGQRLIRRVLYWTAGHPYLTQRLCQAVSEEGASTPRVVDRVCSELFLSPRARDREDNLLFVRDRMLRNEADQAGLLLLYRKVCSGARVRDDDTNPLLTILRLAGITRVEVGYLHVRNRIYAKVFNKQWIAENLPGAELRRLRAAYLRGFKIAGAVFVQLALVSALVASSEVYFRAAKIAPPHTYGCGEPVKNENCILKPPAFWASFTSQSLPTSEAAGTLLIRAGDAGISVFVNGAQYGRTPKGGTLQIPVLPAGDHYEVRLEKPGFQSVTQERVQILADRETRLDVKLSPISQVAIDNLLLISQAPAGTEVSVDGKTVGLTNAEGEISVKVEPGEHEIELKKEGYLTRNFPQHFGPGRNVIEGGLQPDPTALALAAALRSNELGKLQEFLGQYPNSESAAQVRAKMEDLEWNKDRDSNDPRQVQEFINKYPNGAHIAEAQQLANRLIAEDTDWRSVQVNASPELLQRFIATYPHSRHLEEALRLKDQGEIFQVIQAYQDSYNHGDLKKLLEVWPTCPPIVQSFFKDKRSGTVTLSAQGDPVVKGKLASLMVAIKTVTETGDSEKTVPFSFKKENDVWVIENGAL